MKRESLDDLRIFAMVADHRSFRETAAKIGRTPSAVSHAIRQLEERLGVRLFHRTTRSVSPTDAGLRLLARLQPALQEISTALEDLNNELVRPRGRLKLYCTHMAALAVVAPVWSRFLATYPDVRLELEVGEKPIDIVAADCDAGIGPRDRAPNDMIAVKVTGPLATTVVGSPAYLSRRTPPRTPEELLRHNCINYRRGDGSIYEWAFERDGKATHVAVSGPVTVANADLGLLAALDGLGLVYTVKASAEPFLRSGQLVEVMGDWLPCLEGFVLYYPGRRHAPAPLRAFIDMVRVRDSSPASGAATLEFAIPS